MARGNATDNLKTFYVKLEGFKKEFKEPYLSFKQKEGDAYVEVDKQKSVSGTVVGLSVKNYKFEDKDKRGYSLVLVDDVAGERYVIELSESSHGRSILNCLMSRDELLRPIMISVYSSKGKDGKDYKNASVRYADTPPDIKEMVKWKFPIADLNAKIKEVKVGKTIVKDNSEMEEFIFDQVYEFIKKFNLDKAPAQHKEITPVVTSIPDASEEEDEHVGDVLPDNELPF